MSHAIYAWAAYNWLNPRLASLAIAYFSSGVTIILPGGGWGIWGPKPWPPSPPPYIINL